MALKIQEHFEIHDFKKWPSLNNFFIEKFSGRREASDAPLWVFRGQSNESWALESALDRAKARFELSGPDLPLIEEGLVRQFQRRVRNADVTLELPPASNVLAWLSLMRHYGSPTRLLDWTYSFYVALFFAIRRAEGDCAVWAIDVKWSNRAARKQFHDPEVAIKIARNDPHMDNIDTFRYFFANDPPRRMVYRINPFILNERLAIQKGLFLCPGDIGRTFEENLELMAQGGIGHIYKIRVRESMFSDALRQLYYMNVGSETLFPGLDGLAESLQTIFPVREALIPAWRESRGTIPFKGWLPSE